MRGNTKKLLTDFTSRITEQTRDFTGREWVFRSVNDWLADPDGSRFFLLTGEPGSGKTALACRLAQISQGIVSPPTELTQLTPAFLSAWYLCSASGSFWISPHTFIESLALQLAEHYPVYAQALVEARDQHIHVEVEQHVGQGTPIGVIINNLTISADPSPEDVFNRTIRMPLEVLFRSGFDQQVVILVDALDEALSYSGKVNIVSLLAHLDELPRGVRFLLTSRQDSRIEHAFLGADEMLLSATQYEQYNQDDIQRYIYYCFRTHQALTGKIAQLETSLLAQRVATILRKAEGNFLYVRFLLDAVARDQRQLTDLDGLPEGLDRLYFTSLERVVKLGAGDWHKEYAPLFNILSVAQENPTLAQLQSFIQQPLTTVLKRLDELWQFIEEVASPISGETRYRLYHQSVIDFFHSKSLVTKEKKNTFYVSAEEQHEQMADWCARGDLAAIWQDMTRNAAEQGRRAYARRYYILHLYFGHLWQELFAVLDEGKYGRAKISHDPSTRSYAQDLELGRQAAAWENWPLKEGLAYLPYLWRYTLLRSRLASQADNYPDETFQLLLLLKQEQKALGLAELLTDSRRKARVLLLIAEFLLKQPGREAEAMHMCQRFREVASTLEVDSSLDMREYALSWLVQTLAEVGKWAQAEQVIADIRKDEPRARALTLLGLALAREGQGEWAWKIVREAESVVAGMQAGSWEKNDALKSLGEALARLQRWEEAEKAMRAIQRHREKVDALSLLGLLLARGHQQENALRLWNEVEVLIEGMYSERDWKLQILATSLAQAQQFQAAERVIAKIKQNDAKSRALSTLGQELAQTRQLAGAKKAWEEAEQLIAGDGSYALAALGDAFMQGNQLLDAERVLEKIKEKRPKCIALSKLAVAFLQSGQKPRATQILNAIERSIIGAQDDFKYEREIEFFREFGVRMANVKQMEHALEIWQKTEQIIRAMEENEPSRKQDSLARLRLVQSLAQAQQWEQARQVISGFEDMWLKVRGLKELKDVWLQERQIDQARAVWEEIKQVMPTIQDELDRQRLADILMEMQEWDEAEQVIRGLPEGDLTTNQETKLVRELAQAQRWEQAKAFVVSIQDSWTRSVVQAELGMVFTQAQRWDEAEQIIQSIRHLHWILKAWKEWGKALTQAGMVERAQRAWDEMRWQIRFIEWEREKAERLIELGQTLIEVHQWEKSQTIWDMAEQTITTIEGSNERIMKLLELGRVLAHAQQWERMQRVCDAMEREIEPLAADIRDAWERDRYLGYLAEILVLAQRWEEAERVIARTQDIDEDERKEALKIENEKVLLEAEREGVTKILYSSENPRTTALARLGVALSQAHQWEEAGRVIAGIRDREKKAGALAELGKALIQEQRWEEAERVSAGIQDSAKRASTLVALVQALAREHKWQEAEQVLENTRSDTSELAQLKNALGQALVLAGRWEEAERVAGEEKTVLISIANHLASTGEHEHLLHFVQRAWIQVTTRENALNLFPLAYGLLAHEPEMGGALFEAFTWSDNFLQV